MSHDSDAPPPAYEFLQEEFDGKIAAAIETSRTTSPSSKQAITQNNQGEEEWEEWDEAKFEEAVRKANSSQGQSSSGSSLSPTNEPPAVSTSSSSAGSSSNVPKATNNISPAVTKQKPSWYEEAGLGSSSASVGIDVNNATSQPNNAPTNRSQRPEFAATSAVHQLPPPSPTVDGLEDDAPPPFTAVDGLESSQIVTLSWHGNSSQPPSPLTSPVLPSSSPLPSPNYPSSTRQQTHRGSLPVQSDVHARPTQVERNTLPAARRARIGPRPMGGAVVPNLEPPSSQRPLVSTDVSMPHLPFNHAIAYSKPGRDRTPPPMPSGSNSAHALSFYNSSVSATLNPSYKSGTINTGMPSQNQDLGLQIIKPTSMHAPQPRRAHSPLPPPPPGAMATSLSNPTEVPSSYNQRPGSYYPQQPAPPLISHQLSSQTTSMQPSPYINGGYAANVIATGSAHTYAPANGSNYQSNSSSGTQGQHAPSQSQLFGTNAGAGSYANWQ